MTNPIPSPLRSLLPGLLAAATAIAPLHADAAPKTQATTPAAKAKAATSATQSSAVGAPELLAQYGAASEIFIEMMKELSKQVPDPSNNPRENMYAGLAAIWLGGLTGAAFAPAAGTVLGGAIGSLEGGVGAAPGAGIGAGVGVGVAVADLVLLGLLTIKAVEYIEEKYPHAQYSMVNGDAPASAFAYQQRSPHAGAWGPAFLVVGAHAGPYESMVVHIIQSVFTAQLNQMASSWNGPGLAQIAFVKPSVQKLAYIRTHGRVSPGAKKAAPLPGFMTTASVLLTASSTAVEDAWLTALGLASVSVTVDEGKVVVSMPSVLTSVGAPSKITKTFGSLTTPKFGGTGGATDPWIRGKLTPGKFSVEIKDPSVIKSGADKGKIKVVLEVAKGSTLGKGSLEYKWNNTQGTIAGNLSAKLAAKFTASAYFELEGGVLVLDRIVAGSMPTTISMPSIPGPLGSALGTATANVQTKMQQLAQSLMEASPMTQALDKAADKSHKALAKSVENMAEAKGLTQVTGIGSIAVAGGKLVVSALGKKLQFPVTATKSAVSSAYTKAKNKAKGVQSLPKAKATAKVPSKKG